MKYFNKKAALQFHYASLSVEENNYISKIVNVSIVYNLD